ncbi:hypothetical protein [Denitromonas iodatirespirans]|uniref:Uncharacterized protein n=1 Tax=Denitromonas iodatirespirans TaxID=2795389 RepID=A0A944DCX5_DENI1|nr:hypothetical protein [Denitromonas iodatirespirans]MBT0964184.1 hypothetical protein [Denitromonas iodatirespirans]
MFSRVLPLALLALIGVASTGCTTPPPRKPPAADTAPAAPVTQITPAPAPAASAPESGAADAASEAQALEIDGTIPELIAFLEQNPQGAEATLAQTRLRERIGARLIRQAGGRGNIRPGDDFPLDAFATDDLIAGFADIGVGFRLIGYVRDNRTRKTGYTFVSGTDAWRQLYASHALALAGASSARLIYDIRMLRIQRQVHSSVENGTVATFYRDPAYTTQTVLRLDLTRYLKKGRDNGERRRLAGLGAVVLERHGRSSVYAFDLGEQSLIPR